MFRCTNSPPEPSFPSTLLGLNMHLNPSTHQPQEINTGAPFTFFHDADPRINDLRKEAFQTAMRGEMKSKLGEMGAGEYFLTTTAERKGLLHDSKPVGERSVPILMSAVDKVREARDVIVLVGESVQDCGVLAWRLVREREGLERGTVVGFVGGVEGFGKGEEEKVQRKEKVAEKKEQKEKDIPAVIILNPGQLFYSWKEEVAKTLVSWNDGPRGGKMEEFPPVIDEENQVEGHKTATEHVNTFLEVILPGLINQYTRLYFVAIGDGAQNLLTALNKQFVNNNNNNKKPLPSQIEALALICPQITTSTSDLHPEFLLLLAQKGRSWVCSEKPVGELLATIPPKGLAGEMLGSHYRKDHPTIFIDEEGQKEEEDDDDDNYDGKVKEAENENFNEEVDKDNSRNNDNDQDTTPPPQPLTATFSAGKSPYDGITETVFESCMDDVLHFFQIRRLQQRERELMVQGLDGLKFV